ncbi:MAG: HAD family phosphatase [Lachnospiraceae bacterium]|nr:HAD family phosphatase [Lachnospiraceae bacterium]
MMIKNIIFDVGDVLIEYRWKSMMRDYGLSEEEATRIGLEIFDSPYWPLLDYGTILEEEAAEGLSKIYPADADVIRWFLSHGEYMRVLRPDVYERVFALKKAGYRLYILSNYCKGLFEKHTEGAPFLKEMDGMLISYMVHMNKPEHRIYEELLRRFDLRAQECLFFDDRPENVQGAKECGLEAITVTSRQMLIDQLDALLQKQ